MEATRLSGATREERAKTLATLMSAFRADPVERWLYPADNEYDKHFPKFLAAFGGQAFVHDAVWRLDDFAAVALWLPPEAEPDGEEIVRVLMTTVDQSRHGDTMVAIEQMDAAHPRFPHWYLPWFGVVATLQGTGLGGTLLTHTLHAVDETGLPAYLETPNPRTIAFYERHGFQVTGATRTEDCPPITFMLRQPNTSVQHKDTGFAETETAAGRRQQIDVGRFELAATPPRGGRTQRRLRSSSREARSRSNRPVRRIRRRCPGCARYDDPQAPSGCRYALLF